MGRLDRSDTTASQKTGIAASHLLGPNCGALLVLGGARGKLRVVLSDRVWLWSDIEPPLHLADHRVANAPVTPLMLRVSMGGADHLPSGLVFLQYRNETKRALLPNEITSIDTVKALFVRSFPKQLTMQYMDSPLVKIYIHDSSKDMFYELEDDSKPLAACAGPAAAPLYSRAGPIDYTRKILPLLAVAAVAPLPARFEAEALG
ncbi:unnamed protein product [Spodoptera exigua]|nr:unnamed protein product [Spodoptera exigua]